MWNLFGRYKGKKALPSARQMNLIAAILNHVTQGTGISMQMPQQPSTDAPWVIAVDTKWLQEFIGGGGGGADLSGVGASKIVGTNADGEPVAAASLLTTNPTTDKVLSVKKNGTAVSWEDADRPAENPSSTTSFEESYPSSTNANNVTTTWTAGGTKGYVETVLTKVEWTGTYLYGYYRIKTYDRFGRLYSVSRLKRFSIDTPTKVTWS